MKNKIILLFGLCPFIYFSLDAQTPNRSKLKVYEDSMQLIKFMKEDPTAFAQNILPIRLADKSYFIKGFYTGLRLMDNELVDSVYRNYKANMPDTSTVIPYASVYVIGDKVTIDFIFNPMISASQKWGIPLLKERTLSKNIDKNLLPSKKNEKFLEMYSYRITVNGKVLTDWKNLVATSNKTLYETTVSYNVTNLTSYGYLYSLGIVSLNKVNDQMLLEIKNERTGWLYDSYNITRVTKAPNGSVFLNTNLHESLSTSENKNIVKKK